MAFLELIKAFGSAIGSNGKPVAWKDPDGNAVAPRALAGGDLRVVTQSYLNAVTEGKIPDHTPFGQYVYSVSGGATLVLLSDQGYTEQSSGAQRSVSSDDAADTAAGTGIQKLTLYYIDGDGAEGSEEITMNGTTAVNTVSTNIKHINNAVASQVGSGGVAAGVITIHDTTAGGGSPITGIDAGEIRTHNGLYFVPDAKTLYLTNFNFYSEDTAALIQFRAPNPYTGVWDIIGAWPMTGGYAKIGGTAPFVVAGGSKFEVWYEKVGVGDEVMSEVVGWLE